VVTAEFVRELRHDVDFVRTRATDLDGPGRGCTIAVHRCDVAHGQRCRLPEAEREPRLDCRHVTGVDLDRVVEGAVLEEPRRERRVHLAIGLAGSGPVAA
jgi:hypothetical protein